MDKSTYGMRLAEHFGLRSAAVFISRSMRKTEVAVTQLKCDAWNQGLTTPIPAEDAFIIALQLRERPHYDFWLDDRPVGKEPLPAGACAFYDLRRNPITNLISPFHTLAFYLPRKALDWIADDADAARIDELAYRPGSAIDDPVIRNLGACLREAFERPEQASRIFIEHVTFALGTHVAHTYGGMRVPSRPAKGGLAPWQERRAKEFLDANLDGDVSVMLLARACGLSTKHFSRAFRQTTGTSPHRWLVQRRIDKARQILRDADVPLADVAVACGFADQSHLTRVFRRSIGMSPGQWRRACRD